MAEVSFLLLPERLGDEKILDAAAQRSALQRITLRDEEDARENPNDANARMKLGNVRLAQGRVDDAKIEIEWACSNSIPIWHRRTITPA